MARSDISDVLLFYDVRPDGTIYSKRWKRDMSPRLVKKTGYMQIGLQINGKREFWLVHRLVASVHLDKGEFDIVNHIDGNRANNCVDNLEWCTTQQNRQRSKFNKLSEGQEEEIKNLYRESGLTQGHIAGLFGLNQGYVSQILNNKRRSS